MAASRMASVAGFGSIEVDIGLVDGEIRRQAAALDELAAGRHVAGVREPEAAAVGQLHQLLEPGAAERALADELRALVARRAPTAKSSAAPDVPVVTSSVTGSVDRAVARLGGDRLRDRGGRRLDDLVAGGALSRGLRPAGRARRSAPACPTSRRARAGVDAGVERAFRGAADVDDELLGAVLRERVGLRCGSSPAASGAERRDADVAEIGREHLRR